MNLLDLIGTLVLALIGCATAYQLLAIVCAALFLRKKKNACLVHAVPVSILKPLKGTELALEKNIRSFCGQEYPTYEVLLGLAGHDGETLSKVCAMPSSGNCRIIITSKRLGSNEKVSNLHGLAEAASYPLLAISDSDMRVEKTYLQHIVAEYYEREDTGLVTCLYKATSPTSAGAALESLTISLDFMPSVLVARRLEGMTFGLGASLLVSRDALKSIGGVASIADYLADDYQIGNRLSKQGYRVVLSRVVIENDLGNMSFKNYWMHQVRWARTYRASRPRGYLGYGVTHLFPLTLIFLAVQGPTFLALGLPLGAYCLRACLAGVVYKKEIRDRRWLACALQLLPFKDLCSFCIWVWSFMTNKVTWGENTYAVGKDGKMVLVNK